MRTAATIFASIIIGAAIGAGIMQIAITRDIPQETFATFVHGGSCDRQDRKGPDEHALHDGAASPRRLAEEMEPVLP